MEYIGKSIKTLVDSPFGGKVLKGEIGSIIGTNSYNQYIVNFPSQEGYIVEVPIDFSKYELVPAIEKGKWYKCKDWSSPRDFCKAESSPIVTEIHFTENIYQGIYYKTGGQWGCTVKCNLEEASLEEIQEYLPEGHVDKFKFKSKLDTTSEDLNLISGEIYTFQGGYKYVFIFDTVDEGGYVKITSLLTLDSKRFSKSPSNLVKLEESNKHKFKIATTSEKAHLEACIKANKYVEEADIYKEPKFIDGKNYKIISTYTYLYNRSSGKYISIDSTANYLDRTGSGFDSPNYKVVPITPEEEAHLEACIAADKYVNPPKKETLLEEANRRFPIGTKFKSIDIFEGEKDIRKGILGKSGASISASGECYVYYEGKWAEPILEDISKSNADRNKYYKVNSDEEHDILLSYFKSIGEPIAKLALDHEYNHFGYIDDLWRLFPPSRKEKSQYISDLKELGITSVILSSSGNGSSITITPNIKNQALVFSQPTEFLIKEENNLLDTQVKKVKHITTQLVQEENTILF